MPLLNNKQAPCGLFYAGLSVLVTALRLHDGEVLPLARTLLMICHRLVS
jgi:hypothetical protein